WYMFFFQIPWLPEFLLGLGHAGAIGRAFRTATVRRDALADEDIQRLRAAALHSGALRSALNFCRAAFRDRSNAALLPPTLQRFLYGDEKLPPPRRTLADWPRIDAPTLLIWGEQDIALGKELTYG